MSIRNDGDLHSKAELEALRNENDELKKALGEATLDMKILKKKLEMDLQRNKKLKH
jgi:predicted RNase H-like nuclease (RuvC/YqgF family)